MQKNTFHRIQTLSELHQLSGLARPLHPLISLVDYSAIKHSTDNNSINWIHDFYSISLKRNVVGKIKYGQQSYDFNEGLMCFVAPGQILNVVVDGTEPDLRTGWMLLFHPDFLWNSALSKSIDRFEFFQYAINEALFLSEREELILENTIQSIKYEIQANIDQYTQNIIIAQIEVLLNYSDRFYKRQFITRKKSNHLMLARFEELIHSYFNREDLINHGLPSVRTIAEVLTISPAYLSGLIKSLTGQTVQQLIHGKLIEKAKEKLAVTKHSVSEIAYQLGFEHPQSFSKLFKTKTNISPSEFRELYSRS